MGIVGLSEFLKERIPKKKHHLSKLAGRIGIDMNNFLCRYAYSGRLNQLAYKVYQLIVTLRKNDACAVFIFDGKSGDDKKEEIERRKANRQAMRERRDHASASLNQYKLTGIVDPWLKELRETDKLRDRFRDDPDKLDVGFVMGKIESFNRQMMEITDEVFESARKIINSFGIEYINAPTECDQAAKVLYDRGDICALYSQDSDTIAYGINWITDLNLQTGEFECYEFIDVLSELGFDEEQFVDFCILCGCDYNKRVNKIGPSTAFKLINQYRSIENLPSNIDTTSLNHQHVRDYFLGRKCGDCAKACWWSTRINLNEISETLHKYGAFVSKFDNLPASWKEVKIRNVDAFD